MSHFGNKTFPRDYLNTFNITKDMCEKRDNAEIWIVVLNFFEFMFEKKIEGQT